MQRRGFSARGVAGVDVPSGYLDRGDIDGVDERLWMDGWMNEWIDDLIDELMECYVD